MNETPICSKCIFWWCNDPMHKTGFCRLDYNNKDTYVICYGCKDFIERTPKRGNNNE